jgi:hypothetical protein
MSDGGRCQPTEAAGPSSRYPKPRTFGDASVRRTCRACVAASPRPRLQSWASSDEMLPRRASSAGLGSALFAFAIKTCRSPSSVGVSSTVAPLIVTARARGRGPMGAAAPGPPWRRRVGALARLSVADVSQQDTRRAGSGDVVICASEESRTIWSRRFARKQSPGGVVGQSWLNSLQTRYLVVAVPFRAG